MILFSVMLYIVLCLPISLLYEAGHAYVRAANGYDYRIWVDLTGDHMLCFGSLERNFVYNVMGGLFGFAGSTALDITWFFAQKLTPFCQWV